MGLFSTRDNARGIDEILTPKEIETDCEGVVNDNESDNVSAETEETSVETVEYVCDELNPLVCFGMQNGNTEKWMTKCVKIWYYVISFIWFMFGAITFAPVIFISKKIEVFFKKRSQALLVAFLVWVSVVGLIITINITNRTKLSNESNNATTDISVETMVETNIVETETSSLQTS